MLNILNKMLLINKYKPKDIDNAIFHKDTIQTLKLLSIDNSIPHLLFYGANGSGKRTLINMLLEMLFNKSIYKTTDVSYEINGSGNKMNSVVIKQSMYHISITPNSNNFDRYIIQNIVKEYAKRIPLSILKNNRPYKVVVINMIDKLSYYAQTSLRRTMEKYSGTCRFICWCTSLEKVIPPIQSRCACIRIPLPSRFELFKYIFHVSICEHMNLSIDEYNYILDNSFNNPKTALWIMEFMKHKLTFTDSIKDRITDIINLLSLPSNINLIRTKLYNILITNIDNSVIIKNIVIQLCKSENISDEKKEQIVNCGSLYDKMLNKSRREIIHLEAFIINIIKIISS